MPRGAEDFIVSDMQGARSQGTLVAEKIFLNGVWEAAKGKGSLGETAGAWEAALGEGSLGETCWLGDGPSHRCIFKVWALPQPCSMQTCHPLEHLSPGLAPVQPCSRL